MKTSSIAVETSISNSISNQQLKAIPSWDKRINVRLTYLTPRWTINTSLMTFSNLVSELHRNSVCWSSNYVLNRFDQTSTIWLRCANRSQNLFVSTPEVTTVRSYSFNPLWTMITTIFQKTSNTDDILKPIIRRLFPIIEPACSLWSSFIDLFNFAKNRRNKSQGFGAFFLSVSDRLFARIP